MTKEIENLVNKFNEQNGEVEGLRRTLYNMDYTDVKTFWSEVVHQGKVKKVSEVVEKSNYLLSTLFEDSYFDLDSVCDYIVGVLGMDCSCALVFSEVVADALTNGVDVEFLENGDEDAEVINLYEELESYEFFNYVFFVCTKDYVEKTEYCKEVLQNMWSNTYYLLRDF